MLNSEKNVKDEDLDFFKTCELKVKFCNFDSNFHKKDDT